MAAGFDESGSHPQESRSLAGLASHASLAGLASHASFAGLASHASLALGAAALAFTFTAVARRIGDVYVRYRDRAARDGRRRPASGRMAAAARFQGHIILHCGNGGPGAETPDCSLVGFEANRNTVSLQNASAARARTAATPMNHAIISVQSRPDPGVRVRSRWHRATRLPPVSPFRYRFRALHRRTEPK